MQPPARDAKRDVALFERIVNVLASHSSMALALDELLETISEAFSIAAAWIWLVDPETNRFYVAASRGLPPLLQEPVEMTGDSCWCLDAFEEGDFVSKNVRTVDCSRLRRAERAGVPELAGGFKYHASVVLRFGERQLGILNLSSADWRPLGDDELALLAALGSQIGLALERSRLSRAASAVARTDERARLAREIHDTLAQELTGIALALEGSLRALDRDPSLARERIESALAVARRSLDGAREAVTTLRSDPLGGRTLTSALGSMARRFASEHGVIVRFSDESDAALPYAVECEFFRIASEALENVRKHARAHRVDVRLRAGDASATLTIDDDGGGLGTDEPGAGHFGIVGMRERAYALGGTLSLGASDSGGTCVAVTVPVAR